MLSSLTRRVASTFAAQALKPHPLMRSASTTIHSAREFATSGSGKYVQASIVGNDTGKFWDRVYGGSRSTPTTLKIVDINSKLEWPNGITSRELSSRLFVFFDQGNETMKDNYGGMFSRFISAIEEGMSRAIENSRNPSEVRNILKYEFLNGMSYRDGYRLWSFLNLTGRVAHLYGPNEKGGLSFEEIRELLVVYNRFGFQGSAPNHTFRLLTDKRVRKLIEDSDITPREAFDCARGLEEDPRTTNKLTDIFRDIDSRSLKRSAAYAVTC